MNSNVIYQRKSISDTKAGSVLEGGGVLFLPRIIMTFCFSQEVVIASLTNHTCNKAPLLRLRSVAAPPSAASRGWSQEWQVTVLRPTADHMRACVRVLNKTRFGKRSC